MEIAKAHCHEYGLKGPKENVVHARKIRYFPFKIEAHLLKLAM